ncbi:putative ubiquitin-conjugating enzyme E2, ubiquitin-conjugating enzyme/RWD [Helianthus anomalus]
MEKYSRVGVYDKEDVLPHPSDKLPKLSGLMMMMFSIGINTSRGLRSSTDLHQIIFFLVLSMARRRRYIVLAMASGIQGELLNLEKQLQNPDSIFVGAYKSKIDVLTAVIIGQKGTPYHDGLFFIDVIFRACFPQQAHVCPCFCSSSFYTRIVGHWCVILMVFFFFLKLFRLRSFGYAINPHMFECGEVRLHLSHQWTLPSGSIWESFQTTVYDILVAIRDQVLNADPLFHQPGFVECGASVVSEYFSFLYNENVLIKSLKIMTCIMNNNLSYIY